MLVLIYKRSGSKLLFPAVYSEKEMDEKMLVAKKRRRFSPIFARRRSSALRRCRPVRVSSGYAKKTVTGGSSSCPRGSE